MTKLTASLIKKVVEDAPSVVVRNNRTTAEQSSMVGECINCDTCRFEGYEPGEEPCVYCFVNDSMWEPKTEPQKIGYCNECKWFRDKQVCGRCRSKNLYAPKDEQSSKVGEWIYTDNSLRLDDEWACSRCGNISFMKTNFCDRCGAKMKGTDDE